MTKKEPRRFSKKESKLGIHVPTEKYHKFTGMVGILSSFYNNQILDDKPEYSQIRSIIIYIQEIVNLHLENIVFSDANKKIISTKLLDRTRNGRASFYDIIKELKDKKIINEDDYKLLDHVRILRNSFAHISCSIDSHKNKKIIKKIGTANSLLALLININNFLYEMDIKYDSSKNINIRVLPGFIDEMLKSHNVKADYKVKLNKEK